MLTTAIAAMPSSRPTNPIFSFVVAFTPICLFGNTERGGNALLHFGNVRINFGLLRDDGRVHVHDFAFCVLQPAWRLLPETPCWARLSSADRCSEKMTDVLLAERAENGVANRMHERVGVRMAVQALGVRNLDAAENEFASRDQRVNVIANANVNHVQTVRILRAPTKDFRC